MLLNRLLIFIFVPVLGFGLFSFIFNLRYDLKLSNEFPEYVIWKEKGGEYKPEYYHALIMDGDRDKIVQGKTISELKKWFPDMTHSSIYQKGSYRESNVISDSCWVDSSSEEYGWVIIFDNDTAN